MHAKLACIACVYSSVGALEGEGAAVCTAEYFHQLTRLVASRAANHLNFVERLPLPSPAAAAALLPALSQQQSTEGFVRRGLGCIDFKPSSSEH